MDTLCDNFSNLTMNICVICKKQNNKKICDVCDYKCKEFMKEKCVTCGSVFVPRHSEWEGCIECDDCEKRYGGDDMNCDA
jgi:hypothetical protein